MGDLILCVGLFRELASRGHLLKIVVRSAYSNSVKKMFVETPEIDVLSLPSLPGGIWFRRLELLLGFGIGTFLRILGFSFLPLGYLGKNFFGKHRELRFDESFYAQAGVDFNCRWDRFEIDRISDRWNEVREALPIEGLYVFAHEDASRGFFIDRTRVAPGTQIIEPLGPGAGFEVWDYIDVIRGAAEIHVIESSFGALIESLHIDKPKFAYRSARPEAKADPNHEFTYSSDWRVVL